MPRPRLPLSLLLAALAALLVAGSATAAASLQVTSSSRAFGHAGTVSIATQQDPAAYRTTVLVPAAYGLRTATGADRTIGTAVVHTSTAVGELTFDGWIVTQRQGDYANDDCAWFAGQNHLAVWLLRLRQTDGIARIEIPVFVDAAPAGRVELTWCASRAADMTVTGVSVRLPGGFVNPGAAGTYAWRANFDLASMEQRSTLDLTSETVSAFAYVRL
jgi:hypothetical protein